MSGAQMIEVRGSEADQRLDRWLKQRFPGLGHGLVQRILRTGQVRVDGRRVKAGTRLSAGQIVRVPPMMDAMAESPPRRKTIDKPIRKEDVEALRACVLYRDEAVIAINKPAGLAVQGGTGQRRHLDAMLECLDGGRGEPPRLVHRLDKDTSGVLLLARDAMAARALTGAFRDGAARKVYWAFVVGVPKLRRGYVNVPLAKRAARGKERVGAAGTEGKPAMSVYEIVATKPLGRGRAPVSFVVLMPLTGRTHQLRVHCVEMGLPILGDGKYGGRCAFPEGLDERLGAGWGHRLMLHAREIAVPHPVDGTTLRIVAPPPTHMSLALDRLGMDPNRAERVADALLDYADGLLHSPPGTRPARRRPAAAKTRKRAKA